MAELKLSPQLTWLILWEHDTSVPSDSTNWKFGNLEQFFQVKQVAYLWVTGLDGGSTNVQRQQSFPTTQILSVSWSK